MKSTIKLKYIGKTYAVNPNHDEIGGQRCVHTIDELPDEVSLAIIAVPAAALDEDRALREAMLHSLKGPDRPTELAATFDEFHRRLERGAHRSNCLD